MAKLITKEIRLTGSQPKKKVDILTELSKNEGGIELKLMNYASFIDFVLSFNHVTTSSVSVAVYYSNQSLKKVQVYKATYNNLSFYITPQEVPLAYNDSSNIVVEVGGKAYPFSSIRLAVNTAEKLAESSENEIRVVEIEPMPTDEVKTDNYKIINVIKTWRRG